MKRRPGITLIEVLVAIGIMAIGLLAILTLFPLGALRMSEALQSDRTASSASAGANTCDAFGMRTDPGFDPPKFAGAANPPIFATPPTAGFPNASQVGEGFPVFVDPWGVDSANGAGPPGYGLATGVAVGTIGVMTNPSVATPGIWRVKPTVLPAYIGPGNTPPLMEARFFTLPDDITFADNGLPDTTISGGTVQRGGRYTWAYLLRRQNPYSASPVDLTVVVFAGRNTLIPGGEATYSAAGNINDTAVTLSYPAAGTPPNIQKGSWILDTSYNPLNSSVHGDYYRVVAVTNPTAGILNLELQIPLAKPLTAVTVQDNLVEVFERGTSFSYNWEQSRTQ